MYVFVEEQVSTNVFLRMIGNAIDMRQIKRYHERLTITLDKFEVGLRSLKTTFPDEIVFLDSISHICQSFADSTLGGAKRDVRPNATKKWR